MKTYLLIVLFFLITPIFSATIQESKSLDAIIEINNAIVNGGSVYVLCFNSKKGLENEKYFRIGLNAKIVKSTFQIKFKNLPIGDYVFISFQDTNGNGDLDEDVFKIPQEPFAISNYKNEMGQELNFKDLKNTFHGQSKTLTILNLTQY